MLNAKKIGLKDKVIEILDAHLYADEVGEIWGQYFCADAIIELFNYVNDESE